MYIDNITLNGITTVFENGINIVSLEVFNAIRAVLLRGTIDTDINAMVNINEEVYNVNISGGNVGIYKNGAFANDEYFNYLKTFPEQKKLLDYYNDFDYSRQFMFYKDVEFHYSQSELHYDTFGICDTRCFRKYLNEFIEKFDSEKMKFNSKFRLANCGKMSKEQFNFNCFLLLVEFWEGFNQIRDFHSVSQPIIAMFSNADFYNVCKRQIFVKDD